MKRALIACGLDGRHEALAKLQTCVKERRPDVVLFAGGILGSEPASQAEKMKRWSEALDGLGSLGVFTAVIPGPEDVPLRMSLRAAQAAEVANPDLHVAHATLLEQGDAAIGGLGGELTEAEDQTEERLCYARARPSTSSGASGGTSIRTRSCS